MDEGLLSLMRDDLADIDVTETRMFGGIAFMHRGNMLCGVHGDHAMFRVGKPRMDAAFAIEGTGPMAFTGRPMGGFVEADADLMSDDTRREALLALALENARELPAK